MPHTAFDHSPLGTVVLRAALVVYANDALVALLGRRRDELVGQRLSAVLPADDAARLAARLEGLGRGEHLPAELDATFLTPGGAPVAVELIVSVTDEETIVQARDLSDRVAHREKLDALVRLGVALQQDRSDEAIFTHASEGLAALGLGVLLLEPDGDGLRVSARGAQPALRAKLAATFEGAALPERGRHWLPLFERCWRDGVAFNSDATGGLARFLGGAVGEQLLKVAAETGLSRGAAVRVDVRGVPSAVVGIIGAWLTEEDLPALKLLGTQISAALDAARTIADLSRRNAELAALNRLAALAGTSTELTPLFKHGTAEIGDLMGSVAVAIYLIEPSGLGASLAWVHGGTAEATQMFARIPLDSPTTLLWRVAHGGESRVWGALDYPEPARSMIRSMGQEVIASVPLTTRSKAVGVMNVAWDHARKLEPAELDLLKAMGSHFAAAVLAQRLLEDQRRRIADLGLLQEVGRSLVATLEPRQVLDLGVRSLAQSVGVTEAFLLLADPAQQALVIRAVSGAHPELLGRSLPLEPGDSSVAATAYHSRQPVLVEDGASDPRVNQAMRSITGGRAYLALPLIVRDKAIGAVVILDPSGPRRHSPADIERAAGIANQLAVAVENARLYDDLRDSYAALARAQAQSVRQERLAALGELSAVVAHEVRNPLGAIFNALGSLKPHLQPQGQPAMLLHIVREEAERLNNLVSDLLDFARPRAPALKPEPLEGVLDDAIAAALGGAHPLVRVVREHDPLLPPVPMDARLLRQAVLNVALNALQAMPQGGQLTVRARPEKTAGGTFARIEVSDSGAGISAHVRARIFEPFFTTRAAGTGLGLALVKRIVEDHRGEVDVTSEPGQGTTFILRLPLAPAG